MKKLLTYKLLICALYIFAISAEAQIVNNSGTDYADSIPITFIVMDSSGNAITLTDGDSVFLVIWNPGGSKVFRDTIAYNNALLDTAKIPITGSNNMTIYTYKALVSVLDGTTGRDGIYSYCIVAERDTGQTMATPWVRTFQIYQTRDLHTFLDSTITAILSRLAPTTAGRTLQTTTTGLAYINIDSSAGGLSAAQIDDNAVDSATLATNSLHPLALSVNATDEIVQATWNEPVAGNTTALTFGDTLTQPIVNDSVKVDGSALAATANAITATTIQAAAITGAKTTFTAGGADSVQIDESTLGTLTGTTVPTVSTVTDLANVVEAFDNDGTMAPGLELTDIHLIASGNDTAFVARGAGSGYGMFLRGGTDTFGFSVEGNGTASAVSFAATGTAGSGLRLLGTGTSPTFALINSGTGTLFTPAAASEFGLATWNTAFATGFTAASMGDSLNNASYVQGAAGADASPSAWDATDSAKARAILWEADTNTYNSVAGSFGKVLSDPAYVGGSGGGLDSATTSRIIGRKVWGIGAGSGGDSSTAAVRGVNIEVINTNGAAANNLGDVFGTNAGTMRVTKFYVDSMTIDTLVGIDNRLRALAGQAGYTDSTRIRYVSKTGSNADGKTWASAWTTPDSVTRITDNTKPWRVLVEAGDYGTVWACSLKVDNLTIEGIGDAMPIFRYNKDTALIGGSYKWDTTGHKDVGECIALKGDHATIRGIRFTGQYAYPYYGRDPDDSLSVAWVAGKNAINVDTSAQRFIIEKCVFDSCYKPISIFNADTSQTQTFGNIIRDNIFRWSEYHCIDANVNASILENNVMIQNDMAPGNYAIQLLGRKGYYNIVRNNVIHRADYGIYSNYSDSNFITGNQIGMIDYQPYIDVRSAQSNYYTDNSNWNDQMPWEGQSNMLFNSGFELPSINIATPYGWGYNNNGTSTAIIKVNNFAAAGDRSAQCLQLYNNTTVGTLYAYQNTPPLYLTPGNYRLHGKMNPQAGHGGIRDTLKVRLSSTVGTYYSKDSLLFPDPDTSNFIWETFGDNFVVDTAGVYNLEFWAWHKTNILLDNLFFGPAAIDSVTATVGSISFVDSIGKNLTEQGGIAGANIPFHVQALDTSGTDEPVSLVTLGLYDASGVFRLPGETQSNGYFPFVVTSGTWTVNGLSIGYIFSDAIDTVTANDTVIMYGYNVPTTSIPPAQTCDVTVQVRNSDGLAMAGVPITAHLLRSNAVDSTGTPVFNQLRQGTTDASGQVTFRCIWSSFLIPATDWMFSSPSTGNIGKKVTVPRQATYIVNFSQ